MIPKVIHYCWFGGTEKPDYVLRCIESWRKFCPGWEVREWNEGNYDITKNRYMQEAYRAKRWAFVSDYARLDVIYNNGGVYLDTDVELIRPLDILLTDDAYAGFERHPDGTVLVATGLGFGSEIHHPAVKAMLDAYRELRFLKDDGSYDIMACPVYNTRVLEEFGLRKDNTEQCILGMHIYPTEWFCPMAIGENKPQCTVNTYSIHHYTASWVTQAMRTRGFISQIIGQKATRWLVERRDGWRRLKMRIKARYQRGERGSKE